MPFRGVGRVACLFRRSIAWDWLRWTFRFSRGSGANWPQKAGDLGVSLSHAWEASREEHSCHKPPPTREDTTFVGFLSDKVKGPCKAHPKQGSFRALSPECWMSGRVLLRHGCSCRVAGSACSWCMRSGCCSPATHGARAGHPQRCEREWSMVNGCVSQPRVEQVPQLTGQQETIPNCCLNCRIKHLPFNTFKYP